jgi:hypothetical protein
MIKGNGQDIYGVKHPQFALKECPNLMPLSVPLSFFIVVKLSVIILKVMAPTLLVMVAPVCHAVETFWYESFLFHCVEEPLLC